jgi:nucleoside-diphosphate-sugar epimerase
MRVLLTGANGFIGRYVLDALQRRNVETGIIGRKPPVSAGEDRFRGNVAAQFVAPNGGLDESSPYADPVSLPERHNSANKTARFIETDLLAATDFGALMNDVRPTHLLHLAWYAEHGKFWDSKLNLRWVDATVRLVEAFCEAGGTRVVAAGSCTEYDWSHSVFREDETPLNPATLYGTAKDATRRLVGAICAQHRVSHAWGRIFFLFGAGENRARLVPTLIDALRGRRDPIAVNARARRDYLHVSDVAEGFATLLGANDSGAYNISSGNAVALLDIARELARLLDADPEPLLRLAVERPNEPESFHGDNAKLTQLGWRQTMTLTEGLQRTIRESPPSCPN